MNIKDQNKLCDILEQMSNLLREQIEEMRALTKRVDLLEKQKGENR